MFLQLDATATLSPTYIMHSLVIQHAYETIPKIMINCRRPSINELNYIGNKLFIKGGSYSLTVVSHLQDSEDGIGGQSSDTTSRTAG